MNKRWEKNEFEQNFKSTPRTFKQIFIEGNINIPRYQRKFVWQKKNFIDLFDMINSDSLAEKNIFLGNIISSKTDENIDIIDGQQRLTTIYLMLLVLYGNLIIAKNMLYHFEKKNKEKLNQNSKSINTDMQLIKNIIFDENLESPRLKYESDPTANNELKSVIDTFENFNIDDEVVLRKFSDLSKNIKSKKYWKHLASINDHMINTFEFKDKNTEEIVQETISGVEYWYKYLTKEIRFNEISIEDQGTAMEIFERINTTGEKLKTLDLLFNNIYKEINKNVKDQDELKILNDKLNDVKATDLSTLMNSSLPNIINAFNKGIPSTEKKSFSDIIEFYKGLSNHSEKEKIEKIINDLESIIKLHKKFEKTNELSIEKNIVYRITKIMNMKTVYIQLFSKSLINSDEDELYNDKISLLLLKVCVIQLIWVAFDKKNPNLFQRYLDDVMGKVKRFDIDVEAAVERLTKNESFIDEQIEDLLNDKETLTSLINDYPKNSLLKTVFLIIEYAKGDISKFFNNNAAIKQKINWDILEVEHIMPQSNEEWEKEGYWKDNKEKFEETVNLLGNKMIITNSFNKDLSNKKFSEKKKKFKFNNQTDDKENIHILTGCYLFKDDIVNSTEWTAEEIYERNDKIIESLIDSMKIILNKEIDEKEK